MKTILSLHDVHKRFGPLHAVRGISLDVPAGQVLGLLGPNGAGKTTTIKIITGVLPPSAGNSKVDGLDSIADSRGVRRKIGYLPESAPLYREMRVESYLRYRAALFELRGRDRRDAVERVIDLCSLREARRRTIGELSKGFRQRAGLAAALLHNPPLVILDEPTSGLDPSQIAETRRLIRDLAGRRTMLIVSHILPEVEKTCDRIVVIARGRIRADGSPRELLSKHPSGAFPCVIEARAPDDAALRGVLAAIEGVRAISIEPAGDAGDWRRCRAAFDGPADPRPLIAAALARAGIPLRELRAETASLEELYIRLVERADIDDAEPAPGAAA